MMQSIKEIQPIFNSRIVTVFLLLFVGIITLIIWLVNDYQQRLVRTIGLRNAISYAEMLKEFRTLYSSEVIQRLEGSEVIIHHDYKNIPHAIPLPMTLSILLGNKMNKGYITTSIYSPYPFPWRKKTAGLKDGFAVDAWEYLQHSPKKSFFRFDDFQGKTRMRYAIADTLRKSCVQCHNSHPESPKRDWKVGDVRGILEIDIFMEGATSEARNSIQTLLALLGVIALGSLGMIGLFFLTLQRNVKRTLYINHNLQQENKKLLAQVDEVIAYHKTLEKSQEYLESSYISLKEYSQYQQKSQRALINIMADMAKARQQAEDANKAKSQFLATVSHEIRTPMNGVLGMNSLLLESSLDTGQREYAVCIQESAENLMVIINDILDFSKIESGNLLLEYHPINLKDILHKVISFFRHQAQNKHIKLIFRYDDTIPPCLFGDSIRIRQMMMNFVGNALKFTEKGHVIVQCKMTSRSTKEQVWLCISVEDSGIGISEAKRAKIFEAFSQEDESVSRKYGGTGLGLAIVKYLVEQMEGSVKVTSEVGVGSIFYLDIPFMVIAGDDDTIILSESSPVKSLQREKEEFLLKSSASQEKKESVSPKSLIKQGVIPPEKEITSGDAILLVDDNKINQKVAQKILIKMGYNVNVAENGIEALEELETSSYKLVFMDCMMPKMDGFEATKKIRSRASKYQNIPIIAITANTTKEAKEQCFSVGMNGYLTKPINRKKLKESLDYWLSEDAAGNFCI